MSRASTVDVLPEEIKAEIGRLRIQGVSIDAILTHLRSMHGVTTISRSAMGRHVKGLERLTTQIRRSRDVATALAAELGAAPESEIARVAIEALHSVILDLMMRSDDDELDEAGLAALRGNPEGIMYLARAMKDLAGASKTNIEFVEKIEARAALKAKREAAAAVDKIGGERGIGQDTLEAIKAGIFGITAAAA